MTTYVVEPGESAEHGPCPDCGAATRSVWGYVYADELPRATYFIRWTDRHLERGAHLLISIGEWGEGTTPAARRAVGMECRMGADRPGFRLIDAGDLPWGQNDFLGQKLTRQEALGTPIAQEAFAIVDRLIEDDPRFRAFLLNEPASTA